MVRKSLVEGGEDVEPGDELVDLGGAEAAALDHAGEPLSLSREVLGLGLQELKRPDVNLGVPGEEEEEEERK